MSDQAIRVQLTAFDNGFAERLIGSIRRECLDHIVVFGEAHLRPILRSYTRYYNGERPRSSLQYQTPAAYAATFTATGARLRNPDQLRRSPVAQSAPQGVQNPGTLTAAG